MFSTLLASANPAVLVIATILITIAVVGIIWAIKSSRSTGDGVKESATKAWPKVRPILDELITELIKLNAAKSSYDSVLSYSVKYVRNKVLAADFLTQEEKDILSEDLIKQLLDPYLKTLYNQKFGAEQEDL